MEPLLLIIIIVVGFLIWAVIISAIIRNAVNADRLLKHSEAQIRLLADMAIKVGSDPDKVKKVVTEAFK